MAAISINRLTNPLVDALCDNADALGIVVSHCKSGARIIDAGIAVPGSLEAGRRIAEICLGGLGSVHLAYDGIIPDWPLSVHVTTRHPVIACLASQYAGWSLSHKAEGESFNALGSGPARALVRCEELFQELGYSDQAEQTVLVFETDKMPPAALLTECAERCHVTTDNLTVILTPTSSLAGCVQVVARVVEVALHKAHALGFDLSTIVDGVGSAPLAPPAPDAVVAMGRTNDAILFAGQVQLMVTGEEAAAQQLAEQLPSCTSRDYGKPFAEVFTAYNYDFFQVDPMLFSPAQIKVSHLSSGHSFDAGKIAPDLLEKSFR